MLVESMIIKLHYFIEQRFKAIRYVQLRTSTSVLLFVSAIWVRLYIMQLGKIDHPLTIFSATMDEPASIFNTFALGHVVLSGKTTKSSIKFTKKGK